MLISNFCKKSIITFFAAFSLTSVAKEENQNLILENSVNSNEIDYKDGILPFKNSANSVDLGMANVPVRDIGAYGYIVVFSTVSALNAKLKLPYLIDVNCTNALLNTIYPNSATPEETLDTLKEFGIVFERKNLKCGFTIKKEEYLKISNKNYKSQISYKSYPKLSINELKLTLKNGHRVLIGTSLQDNLGDPISVNGFNLKVIGNSKIYDGGLYACQQPQSNENYCLNGNSGTLLIAIGYDDNQQLIKLRNSWGVNAGENGDFYMTYSFYEKMASNSVVIN
ncbi:C1 family peptidase [Pigmentibacter ruber]|uniref:hypothetical protein n=1 Tax=Pigmentibacter ruber TaxID=2683196 RepID=UPI00131DF6B2|nr:hypothetical protein [Pigmentibacter ruber]